MTHILFCSNRYTWRPKENAVYAIFLSWPNSGYVVLSDPIVSSTKTQVMYLVEGKTELLLILFAEPPPLETPVL